MAGVEDRSAFKKPGGDLLEDMKVIAVMRVNFGEVEPSDDPGGVVSLQKPVLLDDVHDSQMAASAEKDFFSIFLDPEVVFMVEGIDSHHLVPFDIERSVPLGNELRSFDPAEEKRPVAKIGVLIAEDEAVALLELLIQTGVHQGFFIPFAVKGTEGGLLQVDRRMAIEGEETVHPSAVVPVSVGKDRKVGFGKIDAQDPGVLFKKGGGPAVEKDLLRLRLDPQRKAVFRTQEGVGGDILHERRDSHSASSSFITL